MIGSAATKKGKKQTRMIKCIFDHRLMADYFQGQPLCSYQLRILRGY